MPLIEAVLNPAQRQHEATKQAILEYIAQEYPESVKYGQWMFSDADDIAKFINELKLEDTQ